MPITREQFVLAADASYKQAMKQVYAFLEAHQSEAFTPAEIAKGVGLDADAALGVLEDLDSLGAAEGRIVYSELYFAHSGELPPLD